MSERRYRYDSSDKSERALQLSEKGLSCTVIAERLSVRKNNVADMIRRARLRREKARAEAAE